MLPLSQNNSEDDAASTDEEGDMSGGDTQEQVLSQFVHVLVCRCIVSCPMLQLLPNLDVVCVVHVEHTHISSPWLSLTLGRCTQGGTLWFHLSLLISTFHSILICTPPLPSFITLCSHPTFSFTDTFVHGYTHTHTHTQSVTVEFPKQKSKGKVATKAPSKHRPQATGGPSKSESILCVEVRMYVLVTDDGLNGLPASIECLIQPHEVQC